MTPVHLIMSYAQESGAVGKEKVNFAEREGSVFLSESLAHAFGWLPFFFVALCTSVWTMVLKTDGELAKKKNLHRVIDTCGKWVTSGRVSICKLLVIHSEVAVKAPCGWRRAEIGTLGTGRAPISRLKPGPSPVHNGGSHQYSHSSMFYGLEWTGLIMFKACVRFWSSDLTVWARLRSSDGLFQSQGWTLKLTWRLETESLSYGITWPRIEGQLNPWTLLEFVSPKLNPI